MWCAKIKLIINARNGDCKKELYKKRKLSNKNGVITETTVLFTARLLKYI